MAYAMPFLPAASDGSGVMESAAPSARDRVYRHVREGILRGDLAAGTFLEEEQVSAAVGVSRTPVREAFQQLQSERLIDLLPRRGAMVRIVTAQELVEVYETRLMFENHAIRRLCRDHLPVPPAMLAALAEMRRPDCDAFRHVQLNTEFHQALVAASGNGVIIALYDSLQARQTRVAMTSVRIEPSRQRIIMDEHEDLVAALAAHDAAGAVAVLTAHLRPIPEILVQLPSLAEGPA
jgi:DNA-binding GntR family transcriptional regulator